MANGGMQGTNLKASEKCAGLEHFEHLVRLGFRVRLLVGEQSDHEGAHERRTLGAGSDRAQKELRRFLSYDRY